MMFKQNKRFFAAILAVALLFSNQAAALATGMEDIPGEYMESIAADLTEPVETTDPVDTTEPTETETEPTTTETESVDATEPTETEEETVPADPWLHKLVSFKSSYPYLWSDPSNVNSQILTDAKNFPAKMRVVDSYAFSDTTTLYKLATADDSQWPADLADFVWVEAKYLQIEAEMPENTCKCCDTCTGDENCLCVCGQCAFCTAEVVTQLQDEATGVAVYAESFPAGTSLSVTKFHATKSRNQFGVPTSKQVFDMDISLRTANDIDYQPEDFVQVKVPVSAPAGTIIGILHTHNGKTTLLDVTQVQSDGTVEFVTDGFSGFAGFTVDFHYNGIDYSIDGMKSILLSKLFAEMKINEDASKATSVVFSDPTLVQVAKEGNDWLLTSLAAFRTNETLVITFADGHVIVIDVTDVDRYINYFGGVVRMETDGSTPPTQAINYTYRRVNGSESTEEVDYYVFQVKSSTRFLRDGYWFNIYEQNGVKIENSGNESLLSIAATAALKKNRIIKFQEYSTAITLSNSVSGVNASSVCTVSVHPRVSVQSVATRNVVVRLNNTQIGYANNVLFPNRNQTSNGWDQYNGLVVNYDSSKYYITTNTYTVGTVPYAYSGGDNGTYTINLYSRYVVAFNANGGSGSMGNQAFIWGTAQNLNANAFTTPTFTVSYNTNGGTAVGNANSSTKFAGWATSATGGVVYGNQQSVNNLTSTAGGTYNLYAKWEATSSVTLPSTSSVTKQGYTLEGWYTDAALTTKAGTPGTSYTPSGTITLYAKWTPNTNTPYTVKHYQQNLNDSNYTEVTADRQTLTGTTGQSTNAVAKNYAGFTAQTFSQATIAADGSTVISIYYNRNSYTVTVNKGNYVNSVSGGGTYKYGASVTINATVPVGYSWVNWTGYNTQAAQSYTFTMPASNVTYTANAAPSTNTAYTVKHYQQNLANSNYTEITEDRQTLTGTTGQSTNAAAKNYAGFTAQTFSQATIAADGSTVISIYYNRNSYTLTVNKGDNVSSVSGGGTYKYGASVTINATVPVGYSWVNWTGYSTQTAQSYTFTMPAGDITYTANAAPNTDTTYIVRHYLQNITDEGIYTEVAEDRQILTGTTGAEIAPAVNTYEGFTAPEVQTVTILADGSLVVKYYYTRNSYTVTLNMGQGVRSVTGSGTYKYGASVTITAAMETGYSWINWTGYNTQDAKSYTFTMPAGDVTYTANGQKTPYIITYQYTGNVPAGAPAVPAAVTAYYQDVVALAAPTMAAYTFSGWSNPYVTIIDGTLTMPISNVLLSGHWTANTYEATFVYGNGQQDSTVKYTAEKTISLPTPTRPGYDFDGWTVSSPDGSWTNGGNYTGSTELGMYGDVTFTAQWKLVVYNLDYDLGGGTLKEENPAQYTVDTETITLNNPEKRGYLFDGWVGANGSVAQTTVTIEKGSINDRSYAAKWTPISYTVIFDGNGATSGSMKDQLFTYDTEQALRTNAYELSYTVSFDANGGESDVTSATAKATFNGWTTKAKETFSTRSFFTRNTLAFEDEQVVSNLTDVHQDEITLYANWVPGSVTLPAPTIYGMRLTGWYTAVEGGQKIGDAGDSYVPEENVTLYAQWERALYTITFNTDGGSAIETITLPEGTEIPPIADPVKPNAKFMGWTPEIPDVMPAYDMTFTAQWAYAETLTITASGEANETFLFTVKDTKGDVELTVSVCGGSSVTIGGLYEDTYTVTELGTWSWTRGGVSACVVTITEEDQVTANMADFTMPGAATWWLHNENHN